MANISEKVYPDMTEFWKRKEAARAALSDEEKVERWAELKKISDSPEMRRIRANQPRYPALSVIDRVFKENEDGK